MTHNDIRTLEELTLAAWPALATIIDDGWVARLADGHTKRANSASALWPSRDPLPAKIARVEKLYARHGLPAVFRLTPLAPADLDEVLDRQGYRRIDETLVMRAPIGCWPADPRVTIVPRIADAWVAGYAEAAGIATRHRATLHRMMHLVVPEHATAAVMEGDRIVAFGLGVLDRGCLGAFEIMVAPSHRRQGLARAIMQSLLAWGRSQGASSAYLQVVAGNAPAIALYRALGYDEVYRYWYRMK